MFFVPLGLSINTNCISGVLLTLIGSQAGYLLTGGNNTFIGANAGSSVTSGTNNVIVGLNNGSSIATSSNNLIVSDGSGQIKISADSTGTVSLPSTVLPVGTNNKTAATTEFVDRAVSAGGYTKTLVKNSKGQSGQAIVINNRVFISGDIATTVGKATTTAVYGFVYVPFLNSHQIPGGTTVTDVTMCGQSLYVVLSNGWVYSFGYNGYGQLGHGDTTRRYSLTRIEFFVTNSISINKVWGNDHSYQGGSNSYGYAFFRGTNGTLYGAGYNGEGELGVGNTTQQNTPIAVTNISNVTMLSTSCGAHGHTLAVSSNNPKQVWTWGYNANSQLANGNTTNQTSPAVRYTDPTNNITKVLAAADTYFNNTVWSGGAGTSYILVGGQIYSAGHNGLGQLGVGDTTNRSAFTLANGSNYVDIDASGGYYSSAYAISNTGTLFSTGYNNYGQLGLGDTTNRSSFTATSMTNVESMCASVYSSYGSIIVKTTDGRLHGAGYNGTGGLGRGTAAFANTNTTFAPMAIPYPGTVVDYTHKYCVWNRYDSVTFAIMDDGALIATGNNNGNILANNDVSAGQHNDTFGYCRLSYK